MDPILEPHVAQQLSHMNPLSFMLFSQNGHFGYVIFAGPNNNLDIPDLLWGIVLDYLFEFLFGQGALDDVKTFVNLDVFLGFGLGILLDDFS